MRTIIIVTLSICVTCLFGQKENEVHQYFDFQEGIYLSHEALMQNKPDIKLANSENSIYNNPLKILRVAPSDFGLKSDQRILYVVDQGLPYYRSMRCCPDTEVYIGMTIVGRLSVVSFESEKMVDIPMTAYNPYNGEPFLTGSVKRERKIKVNKVIDMETGDEYMMNDTALQVLLGAKTAYADLDMLIDDVSQFNKDNKVFIKK